MPYNSVKEAISKLYNIPEEDLIKLKSYGLENEGIYKNKDRIYKVSTSKREFLAAQRLIGKDLKNVVNIYSVQVCKAKSVYNKIWTFYLIEEELLFRNKKEYLYDSLDLNIISKDIKKRVPFMLAVMNGIIELSELGIFHNDLHCGNILMDKNKVAKIIDFGIVSLKKI